MRRAALTVALTASLIGCSPGSYVPSHVYRHLGDRWRASLPFYGQPCGSARWQLQFKGGNARCYNWVANKTYSGVWYGDGRWFLPGRETLPATRDFPRDEIQIVADDPKLWKLLFDDPTRRVRENRHSPSFFLRFEGRETESWNQYGRTGRIVIIDRIITGRQLKPAE